MKIENNVLLKVTEMDIDENGCFRIPDGVTEIKAYAFAWRKSLKEITIPDSVREIGNCAFYRCESLKEITITNSVTKIKSEVFAYCTSLEKIIIPDSVTGIGSYSFSSCKSLKKITIPDSVREIGNCAFFNCISLKKITIPDSVIKIRNCAFFDCISLKETTISSSMTEIEEDTFRGCKSLKEITIPESVKTIGSHAFYGCKSLKGITILNDLASIDDYVFENCENLRRIDFAGQTYPVKCVDGSCMRVLHKKQIQDITILKCMYFPETEEIVYVAEKDNFSAHGKTIGEAVEDLQFKILQDKNLEEHIQRIKQQGYMDANDYRLLTGACREGTNRFLQEHGLTWEDTMPVSQVLEITKGQYGFNEFQKAAKQILQK